MALSAIQQAEQELREAQTAESKAARLKLVSERKNIELEVKVATRREKVFDERILLFSGEVNEYEVRESVERLLDLRYTSLEPIVVILNSVGGDIFDGLLLFDTLQALRDDGIEVIVKVRGLAASMGSVLSQAGDVRTISRNSWLMIHEPSTITWGKAGDIKREADLLGHLHKQLSAILAERSTMTANEVARRSRDKDWWLPAEEAVRLGFFDLVAS